MLMAAFECHRDNTVQDRKYRMCRRTVMNGGGNKAEVGEQLRTAAIPSYPGAKRRRRRILEGQITL